MNLWEAFLLLISNKWTHEYKIMSWCLLFVIVNLNGIVSYLNLNPTAAVHNQQVHLVDVDLGISQQTEISKKTTTLSFVSNYIEVENSVFTVFVALRIKNSGDGLKKITTLINRGEDEWEHVFSSRENFFDIHYNFSQETELFVPLEGFSLADNPMSRLHMNITLEYYPSIDGITALFTLIDSKFRQVLHVPELVVLIFPDIFYISTTADIQQIHRVVLCSYYITRLLDNSRLLVVLRLDTKFQIESPELIGATMQTNAESNKLNEISMVLDKNLTKIGIRFKPKRSSDELQYSVKISVKSTETQKTIPPLDGALDISDHPVPVEIMNILLPLVLFGVPLVVIYKHRETRTSKKIQEQSNK